MPQRIVPFIAYEDASDAIDWLERAFGFLENRSTILREPEDPGIGRQICSAEDLEGHRWMFGQRW